MNIDEATFTQICTDNGIPGAEVAKLIDAIKKHMEANKKEKTVKPEPIYSCVIIDPTGTVPPGLTCAVLKAVEKEDGTRFDDMQMSGAMTEILNASKYGAEDTIIRVAKKSKKHGFQVIGKQLIYCYPVKHNP